MNQFELFARHYHSIGFNVTCISNSLNQFNFYGRNILKNPNHKWDHLFDKRQMISEVEGFDWDTATGVGSVTEFKNIRVIDIDGCHDYEFLNGVLDALKLPRNYEWAVKSGSNNGFHIYI